MKDDILFQGSYVILEEDDFWVDEVDDDN